MAQKCTVQETGHYSRSLIVLAVTATTLVINFSLTAVLATKKNCGRQKSDKSLDKNVWKCVELGTYNRQCKVFVASGV